jgi:two-component system, cell cycle response regulator
MFPSTAFADQPRPHVLIADDDEITRQVLESWLQNWGYQTILTSDGADAWSILERNEAPEIVITDWMMPTLDGIEFCRRLRANPRAYYPYVLMTSARDGREDIAYALAAGADEYLTKPLDPTELRAKLAVASRIFKLQEDLIFAREQLRVQATRDALTGLWNRAAFMDLLEIELDRAHRSHGMTGLLMLDVDQFKSINDTFGHLVGDAVLQEVAQRVREAVRRCDFAGRYGGDEFCIALPDYHGVQLRQRAESIRLAISRRPVATDTLSTPITLSIGAVVADGSERSATELIAAADIALYSAKNAGRNRTVYCARPGFENSSSPGSPHVCSARCNPGLPDVCMVPGVRKSAAPARSPLLSFPESRPADRTTKKNTVLPERYPRTRD